MNKTGHVYWITGLSGAGKTTIGRLWYQKLREEKENVVFLDGDALRPILSADLGYTEGDRRKSGMRNMRLCKLLSDQGLDVVCCTISMFHEVRSWGRANIPNYHEIYVKVTIDTLLRRDQKGLYTTAKDDVAGLHVHVEEPEHPDLILPNDGETTPEEQVNRIACFMRKMPSP